MLRIRRRHVIKAIKKIGVLNATVINVSQTLGIHPDNFYLYTEVKYFNELVLECFKDEKKLLLTSNKKKLLPELRKIQCLHVAYMLYKNNPYDVSVANVAKKIGCCKSTVVYYYKNNETLQQEVVAFARSYERDLIFP